MVNKKIDEIFDSHYLKIKQSIDGLSDIFAINFLERNFYNNLAKDNINALNQYIIELFKVLYSPRQVRRKLRELKYDELEIQEDYLE